MIGEFYTTVGINYTNKEKNQLEMDIKFKVYCEQKVPMKVLKGKTKDELEAIFYTESNK